MKRPDPLKEMLHLWIIPLFEPGQDKNLSGRKQYQLYLIARQKNLSEPDKFFCLDLSPIEI